jgi:Ca2+-transporting ATPase
MVALLGFRQEYRAEKSIAALKKLAAPRVKLRRDGRTREVSARQLVPGDVVLLETGNLVPADCRILKSRILRIQESALTGESQPVNKAVEALADENVPLADRNNMAFMGTVITYGRGEAIVTETGMETELGQLARMIQTIRLEPTPLQVRLSQLAGMLSLLALGLVVTIVALGLLRGQELKLVFLTAVSMAVAAIPEGLPAVVTIALAVGAQRMLKRNALIRKLLAVETLGSVTVICADKTGTLTRNRLVASLAVTTEQESDLVEHPLDRQTPWPDNAELEAGSPLALLLTGGALCNDALLEGSLTTADDTEALGDPTEIALLVMAAQLGLDPRRLNEALPRVSEVPFDSDYKRMSTVHKIEQELPFLKKALSYSPSPASPARPAYLMFTKGAVDQLLPLSTAIWVKDHPEEMSQEWQEKITESHDRLAGRGMRVLGIAFKPLSGPAIEKARRAEVEQDLILLGMVGMIDLPRPESRQAVADCRSAGIRPIMITGDHALTAQYIARLLNMKDSDRVLTGPELDLLTDEQLESQISETIVYARVSPAHKLRIVKALQNHREVVAMTGDGVNDAPALRKADIGVAMGITGTDVSKEAADMILLDDNFASIVAAVREGRILYENLRRFVKYLTSCNAGEIWVMLLGPVLGMPLPLLPLQILWMNLVTDGLPALALGIEPGRAESMQRPPKPPEERIFNVEMTRDVLSFGLFLGLVSFGFGYTHWLSGNPEWQTLLFTTLTLSQMSLALALRSDQESFFQLGWLSNPALLAAVALTFLLQMAVVYVPFLQGFFKTVPLSLETPCACC